jgi:hypothetical protein
MSMWWRGSDVKISREEGRPKGGKREEHTDEPERGHARRSRRLDRRAAAAHRVRI